MKFFLDVLLLLPFLILFLLESFLKLLIPKRRKSVAGEIVLITGAGHGIGRLTAFEFAKLKSRLVLWDINKHGIEDTAAECRRLGATVHSFVVDCSNREDIYSSAKKVKAEIGDVSILVNNAGVVYTSDLFATQDPQIEKTFEVNVLAHFWTTKAFLPAMMRNNHGHIVTVASAAGHIAVPFLLAYCSSKFAAVGFHKSLTEELAALGITGVKTTCLCPNFINTGFIKNPSTNLGRTLEPEEVVNKLMVGILTGQKMLFVPSSLSFFTLMERILPERFLAILKRKVNIKFDAVIGYKTKEH
ncbi:estradiol 17-beta-dehydrogenase 11 [Choloepus didactylus]|uniref:estradiol 17-beta-dehydrogenase 11 n=1 Tax=Choloepus didactylus TaxID=27675 RepID=UPI00189EC21D|nr:estradiol 17-beta-dehydrogenase 11 [Choloepus didactylus]